MRPASFVLSDMSLQGDAYIERVRSEAARIVQQAKSDAEQVRRDAEKAGRLAAEQAIAQLLDEKVGKQMESLRPALDQMVEQLDAARGEWTDRWERSAMQLAVAIAERILNREIEKQPEVSLAWIREALELAAGSTEVLLLMNPTDHSHLGSQVEALAQTLGRSIEADIVADESLPRGGCLIRTKYGEVDLRLRSQLDRLEEELTS